MKTHIEPRKFLLFFDPQLHFKNSFDDKQYESRPEDGKHDADPGGGELYDELAGIPV